MKTIRDTHIPFFPCEDCGHVAWARMPLIGGREFVCTICHPVRSWSPISDAEYRAAITKTKPKAPRQFERDMEEAA